MPAYGGDTLAYVTLDQVMAQKPMFIPGDEETIAKYGSDFPKNGDELGGLDQTQKLERATRNSWDLVAYIVSLKVNAPPPAAPRPPGAKAAAKPAPKPQPKAAEEEEY